MLDLSHATEIDDVWAGLRSQAKLPVPAEEFFSKSGQKRQVEQREFDRHYLRCQAIMRLDCEQHAVYMKDCSRAGMGLVSPVQLFPRERIQIWMNPQRSYSLEVIRCRRIDADCYECGTIFLLK
ncbi:MAG: PilZ domain-containing protein [Bythopirellula sp.]